MRRRREKGITLVEALVAISIVLLATTGPIVRIKESLVNTQYAQDQMVASYLAQEGIEVIRAIRDSNWIAEVSSFETINQCFNATCTVDATEQLANSLSSCGELLCPPLEYSGGVYHQRGSSNPSKFIRTVEVSAINQDEIQVVVSVQWDTRPGKSQSIQVTEHLFDFQP